MARITKNGTTFNISDIQISNPVISWENHILRVSEITRIWMGNIPPKHIPAEILLILLFLTLSSPQPVTFFVMGVLLAVVTVMQFGSGRTGKEGLQVNVELDSGKVLSFLAVENASAEQFYDSLKSAITGNIESEITFDSHGRLRVDVEEAPGQTPAVKDISIIDVKQNPLLGELQKLYQSITKKTDANSELLHLIDETVHHVKTGNREGLKQEFEQFITLGLIGDCNELGLESLIQEIKSSLY